VSGGRSFFRHGGRPVSGGGATVPELKAPLFLNFFIENTLLLLLFLILKIFFEKRIKRPRSKKKKNRNPPLCGVVFRPVGGVVSVLEKSRSDVVDSVW